MCSKWHFFLLTISFAIAGTSAFSNCGSDNGSVVDIYIPGCENPDERCKLFRNTNASVSIIFEPNEPLSELNAVVHGIVLGVPVPFALPNANACENSGLKCPLVAGQTYNYTTTLPVLKKYPRVTVDVKWELRDKDEKDVVCVIIPAKIA